MTDAARLATHEGARASLRVGALGLKLYHHGPGLPPALPERSTMADAMQTALRDSLDPNDPSYWVIRQMNVRFQTEAALGVPDLIAGFVAQLRDQIARVLAGELIEGVRRYDTRAAWLADCLLAQANGTAAQQWQFARYRNHAALPPGDAVRLTIASEGADAMQALALIAQDQRLRPFCGRIGEASCRAVLRTILPKARSGSRDVPPALRDALALERAATPRTRYGAALTSLVQVHSADSAGVLPSFASIERATRFAMPPRAVPFATSPPDLSKDATPQDQSETVTSVPKTAEETSQSPKDAASKPAVRTDIGPVLETGFAGVFVLWRSVIEMKLLQLLPDGPAGGPARLALASTLAGPAYQEAWADPALHWLCDFVPDTDQLPEPPADLAARFATHFVHQRRPFPVLPVLTQIGRLTVLQDRSTQDWLWVGDRRRANRLTTAMGAAPGTADPEARDPAVDLQWFDVMHRKARRPWVLLARAAYGDFARRLNGLQGASAAWSWDKLLAGWGTLEQGTPACMNLPRVQLDLVLRMGGLDGSVIDTPGGPVALQLPGTT